jgi:hypothetical protein
MLERKESKTKQNEGKIKAFPVFILNREGSCFAVAGELRLLQILWSVKDKQRV